MVISDRLPGHDEAIVLVTQGVKGSLVGHREHLAYFGFDPGPSGRSRAVGLEWIENTAMHSDVDFWLATQFSSRYKE